MGELRLSLLGSPQLYVDGEEKILRERKAIALLAYLAVEQTVQGRDTLATLFWPEHDQQRARANLRYLLWSFRKTVGADWLAAEGDQIALADGGQLRVDVAEFRRHLNRWRAHSHAVGAYCAACVEALEAAAQLYRGDFLQGFTLDDSPAFDDWQFFQAEELRRELAAGLEALVAQQIIGQKYEAAIAHARRWLALDPLHEPANRALMKLYAWTGQYEAAIRQFHRCVQALQEEIGVEPDAETTELYAQIRNRRFAAPASLADEALLSPPPLAPEATATGNLPPISTAFVGRQTELAQIAARLADPSARLLTIVGPGGMGKSTLAVQAGRAEEAHFPDGVWFVSLAGMESPEQIPSAILAALQIPSGGGMPPRRQLSTHLRRKQSLLILDNFEDVLPAAEFVAELLRACPQVKVLVTSRERLNLREERLLPLGHLAYPTDATIDSAEGSKYSALHLFEISAQRTQPSFALDATNLPSVVRICQLVDGMPLALEMAGAWVRVLSVAEIPAEIERSLAFLATGARDVAERHRSIHAVFDHSWQLLTGRERSVLRQLAVFRNGFSREGAEAVAGASLLDLSALLDKSWLRLDPDGRYQMHGLAHQYTLEKLQSGNDEKAADVLKRHCFFYADMLPPNVRFSAVDVEVPAAEVENVRLAWQTALEQHHWRSLGQIANSISVLMDTWGNLGFLSYLDTTITQLDAVFQSIPSSDKEELEAIEMATIWFLHMAGECHVHLGTVQTAVAYLSRGRSLLERHRNSSSAADMDYARIILALGFAHYNGGQFSQAEANVRAALTILESLGDTFRVGVARLYIILISIRQGRYNDAEKDMQTTTGGLGEMDNLDPILRRTWGWILTKQGRYGEARSVLKNLFEATTYRYRAHAFLFLGPVARCQGNPTEAQELLQRGFAIADETGDLPAQSDLSLELGLTSIQIEGLEVARDYFNRSLAIAKEIGRLRTVPLALMGLGQVELMRGRMQPAREYFIQALTAEEEVQAPPDVLDILVCVGELYATEEKSEVAIELLDLAVQHPATTAETRTRALSLLQTLGAEPSVPESQWPMDAANLRLEEAARHTLAELRS